MIKPKEPTQPPETDDLIVIIDDQEVSDRRRCIATTHAGGPCQGRPIKGNDYCHSHHPEREDIRKQSAQAMIQGRRDRRALKDAAFLPNALDTADDLLQTVHGVVQALLLGKLQPKIGTAVFYGINAACRIQDANKKNETLAKLKIKFGANGEQEAELTIEGVLAQIQKLAS